VAETIPIPPQELHQRVAGPTSDELNYQQNGRRAAESILALLPSDWDWQGKRVLDFGCGPGRVVRHLATHGAELHCCDIHRPSVAWLAANSPDGVLAFECDELPPLDRPDQHFDLVYVVSVFTHLSDSWSRWLLELHRLLVPGGLLVATFAGEADHGQFEVWDEPWDEDRTGMNVLAPATPWDAGGPAVFHSRWWLRAHWGRAFEFLDMYDDGFGGLTHGAVLLRKRDVELEPADLERPEPGEPRELEAVKHNVRQLTHELHFRQGQIDYQRWLREHGENGAGS
jgi:SAM-dependent methyltransferase